MNKVKYKKNIHFLFIKSFKTWNAHTFQYLNALTNRMFFYVLFNFYNNEIIVKLIALMEKYGKTLNLWNS